MTEERPLPPPRPAWMTWGLRVALLAVAVALGYWWGRPETAPAAADEPQPATASRVVTLSAEARRQAGITVTALAEQVWHDTVEATAVLRLDERRTARVGAMLDGIVSRLGVEVGDRVGRHTVLAAVRSHLLHEIWAAHRIALAGVRQRESELGVARDGAARAERLLAGKAIAGQELERARAALRQAEDALAAARAERRRSEEELDHYGLSPADVAAARDVEEVSVRTPIAGVVLERGVAAGTAVTAGAPMFVVSDLSVLWAVAEVDEARLPALASGREVQVRVAAYPDRVFAARIEHIGDRVDPETRRVTVRCTVPNADGRLKPDMFATVRLAVGAPRRGIALPAAAVQELDGQASVFIERADGAFEAVSVEVVDRSGDLVSVGAGLSAGQRVATAGAFLLKSELLKPTAE